MTANLGEYADPRVAARLGQVAEAIGWEAFFVWDHLGFVWDTPSGDPWVILSAVAASTTRLKLGLWSGETGTNRGRHYAVQGVSLSRLGCRT